MLQLSKLFPAAARNWLAPALCLLVVGALGAIFLFNVPASNLLLMLLVLACPLSHLLLGHGAHGHAGHHQAEHQHPAGAHHPEASTPAAAGIDSRSAESSR